MLPKASIKETTRTLTFNSFISTIRVEFWSRSRNIRALTSQECENLPQTTSSSKASFQQVNATGDTEDTDEGKKALRNRTHNERKQMWAQIDIHHASNSQINPLNGTYGQ